MVKDLETSVCPDDCSTCNRQFIAFDAKLWCQERNLLKQICRRVGFEAMATEPATGLLGEIGIMRIRQDKIDELVRELKAELAELRGGAPQKMTEAVHEGLKSKRK